MNAYLDLAHLGKNEWWRFILAIALILLFWQFIGALPSVFLIIWVLVDGNPKTGVSPTGQFLGVQPAVGFTATMLASVLFILGLFLAVRYVHQRPLWSLINSRHSLDWKRIFQGFTLWLVLAGLMSLVEELIYPGRYVWTFNLGTYIPFIILALILIPIQTSAEELFFRGYILQGVGLRLRNIWILSAISGFLFMVPHFLNPEAQANYGLMGFFYFFFGAVMAYITLRDGRLELALGVHSANNLFTVLVANYTVTVLPTPSLFTINTLDPLYSVLAGVIGLVGFVLVIFGLLSPKGTQENFMN